MSLSILSTPETVAHCGRARPTPYLEGFTMPLGWEEELAARGIAFEVIEIPIEQPSNDGVAWEGIEEPTSTNEP